MAAWYLSLLTSLGICGVFNPILKKVEWKEVINGAVIGFWDDKLSSVKWIEKRHHGLSAVKWNSTLETYECITSCGWFDEND